MGINKRQDKFLVFILLPIFNEQIGIKNLIKEVIKNLDESEFEYYVVCVNDGSTDNTPRILRSLKLKKIKIISHQINLGLGSAVMTGINYVVNFESKHQKLLVRLDADNTHDPKYIKYMIDEIIINNYDIIIASRFVREGGQTGVPANRKIISNLANFLMGKFLGMSNIKEITCGYRAYKVSFVKKVINSWNGSFFQLINFGFCSTVEKLVKLNICGAKIKEIPFKLRYEKKESKSKMVFSITTIGYILILILYYWPFGGWKYKRKNK